LECVVSAQSDPFVCLLENVRNKSGLSAEVCEGGPFMCVFFWFMAGGYGRLSRGGMCVCVCIGNPLFRMMSWMVSSSSLYSSCCRW